MQPYPLALALLSSFGIFLIEVIAFRIGTAKLKKLGIRHGMCGSLQSTYVYNTNTLVLLE